MQSARMKARPAAERWAHAMIASVCLGSCLALYAQCRAVPPVLLPGLHTGYVEPESHALRAVCGSYPSFAHVVAMTFLCSAVLGPSPRRVPFWAVFWMGVNIAWELFSLESNPVKQTFMKAAAAAIDAPGPLESKADAADAAAAILGAVVSVALVSIIRFLPIRTTHTGAHHGISVP